ncbi:MAG: hypothetical protein U5J95_07605 [Balneolaceae bacterium]|nr:hypothetical protein [Balneolaceae bacterium]
MLFKTLAFLFVLYLIIRVVRRFFLPSGGNRQSNARFFYQAFRNIQKQQQQNRKQKGDKKSGKDRFDEIEEADFEEIEDEESKTSD